MISIDALRGLDMLLIVGLSGVIRGVALFLPSAEMRQELWGQMGHVAWEGLTVFDLIFPLFVFISGVSMFYSFRKTESRGVSRVGVAKKLWKRAVVLVALGWLVNWEAKWGLDGMRYASVLGLIGISCAGAGSIALVLRRWWQRTLAAVLLIGGVGAVQYFGGDMSPTGCVNAAIDALLCPGRLHLGTLDPEGPLCIVSAVSLCLGGMVAGGLLDSDHRRWRAAALLLGIGGILLLFSSFLGPVIKNIWTPSFVCAAAGIGYMLLGVFHGALDSERGAVLSLPLRIVGVNALSIYLITHVLPYEAAVCSLCAPLVGDMSEACRVLICGLCQLGISWLICWLLWRKKLFIKI